MSEERVLTEEIAEELVRIANSDEPSTLYYGSEIIDIVPNEYFTEIEDEAAKILSKQSGMLCLRYVRCLSESAAESLAKGFPDCYLIR